MAPIRLAPVLLCSSLLFSCSSDTTDTSGGPLVGSLQVSSTTTGSVPDPDGYLVSVDGKPGLAIASDASLTVADLTPGNHSVELTGFDPDCEVAGSNPRSVTVGANLLSSTAFALTCGPSSLEISTGTTGSQPDPDGYTVLLDQFTQQPVGDNDTILISGITPGVHAVTLMGLAGNCATQSSPRSVTVPADALRMVSFAVSCPGLGTIKITVTTTGTHLPPFHLADVDQSLPIPGIFVPINGSATSPPFSAGVHTVTLSVLNTCAITGSANHTVTVPDGGQVTTTYTVTCS
jgi:hypothetical protein